MKMKQACLRASVLLGSEVCGMRRWVWLLSTVVLAWFAASFPSAGLSAQDVRSRARAEFQRGVTAFETGRYEEALAAFQEAYRLKPHPSVRLNMAACYEELGRPLEALVHYRAFLAESPQVSSERKREVERAIREAKRRVARLELDVAPDGARVTIDDAERRRAPLLDPVLLNPGEHVVRVEMPGYATLERRVRLGEGERKRLDLRLREGTEVSGGSGGLTGAREASASDSAPVEREASSSEDVEEAVPSAPSASSSDEGAWRLRLTDRVLYAGVGTGVAALLWVGAGVLALGAESTYQEELARANDPRLPRPARVASADEARSAASRANTWATVSDVFLVLTVAGAGVTGWFVYRDGRREERESVAASVAWVPRRGGGALVVGGRF